MAIVLIVLIIAGYKKKKEMLGKIDLVMIMVMSVLGIVYLGITIFKSIETLAAYYFLMPLFGAATWMQIVRNGIAVGITKNEKQKNVDIYRNYCCDSGTQSHFRVVCLPGKYREFEIFGKYGTG